MFRYFANSHWTLMFIFGLSIFTMHFVYAKESSPTTKDIKAYNGSLIAFDFPKNWNIEANEGAFLGHSIIKIGTTGISTITIEIISTKKDDSGKKITEMQLIKNYSEIYNRAASSIGKLETNKSAVVYSEIDRKGKIGLKESRSATLFGENVAYIKEFFLIDLKEGNAFVTLDSDKMEHGDVVSGFEGILVSLKERTKTRLDQK